MDDKIKELSVVLKKLNHYEMKILNIANYDCPSVYGLKDSKECVPCDYCYLCWEQALENIKDE